MTTMEITLGCDACEHTETIAVSADVPYEVGACACGHSRRRVIGLPEIPKLPSSEPIMRGLFDGLAKHLHTKARASYFLANRTERKLRRALVQNLSVALARIKEQSIYATGWGDMAIDAVIEGDWDLAFDVARDLEFNDDGDYAPRHRARWKTFRTILQQGLAARHNADLDTTIGTVIKVLESLHGAEQGSS